MFCIVSDTPMSSQKVCLIRTSALFYMGAQTDSAPGLLPGQCLGHLVLLRRPWSTRNQTQGFHMQNTHFQPFPWPLVIYLFNYLFVLYLWFYFWFLWIIFFFLLVLEPHPTVLSTQSRLYAQGPLPVLEIEQESTAGIARGLPPVLFLCLAHKYLMDRYFLPSYMAPFYFVDEFVFCQKLCCSSPCLCQLSLNLLLESQPGSLQVQFTTCVFLQESVFHPF